MKVFFFIICGLFLVYNSTALELENKIHKAKAPEKVYSCGIIPIAEKNITFTRWNPIVNKVTEDLDFKLRLSTNESILEYEDFLKLNVYDFALVSHFQFENMVDKDEYKLITINESIHPDLLSKDFSIDHLYYFVVKKTVPEIDIKNLVININRLKKIGFFKGVVDKISINKNFLASQVKEKNNEIKK